MSCDKPIFDFALSCSFDDSNVWSTPEVYPFGPVSVLLTSEHLDDHLTTGRPASVKVNSLPAEALARRKSGGSGYIKGAGWDGYDHSEEEIKIYYAIEAETHDAALVVIPLSSIALIRFAVRIIVVATKKKLAKSRY
jgi:hypothetical protein